MALDNVDVKTIALSHEAAAGAALGVDGEATEEAKESQRECPVCFDLVSDKDSNGSLCGEVLKECGHFACNECLFGHVRVRVMDEGDLSLLVCPAEACRARISAAAVEEILAADQEAVSRFRQLQASAIVAQSDRVVWCPAAGCSASIELPPHAASKAVSVTCSCGAQFCFGCKAMPHHEPSSCAAWAALVTEMGKQESASEQWIEASTTRCRGCTAPIEKSQGCNHMKCTQCRVEFCYACGAAWHPRHYQCERPSNPDNRSQTVAFAAGGAFKERRELVAWCVGGYRSWEQRRIALAPDYWHSLARLRGVNSAAAAVGAGRGVEVSEAVTNGGASAPMGPISPASASGQLSARAWGAALLGARKAPAASGARLGKGEREGEQEVTSRYWVELESGAACLNKAHTELVFSSRVMACSFAIDIAIPTGYKFMRARRRLRQLRANLEIDLQPLTQLVVAARLGDVRIWTSDSTETDISLSLALLYVLQTEADLAQKLMQVSQRVRRNATRLVGAGRAGVLTAPSTNTEMVAFLASEVLQKGRKLISDISNTTMWKAAANYLPWMSPRQQADTQPVLERPLQSQHLAAAADRSEEGGALRPFPPVGPPPPPPHHTPCATESEEVEEEGARQGDSARERFGAHEPLPAAEGQVGGQIEAAGEGGAGGEDMEGSWGVQEVQLFRPLTPRDVRPLTPRESARAADDHAPRGAGASKKSHQREKISDESRHFTEVAHSCGASAPAAPPTAIGGGGGEGGREVRGEAGGGGGVRSVGVATRRGGRSGSFVQVSRFLLHTCMHGACACACAFVCSFVYLCIHTCMFFIYHIENVKQHPVNSR